MNGPLLNLNLQKLDRIRHELISYFKGNKHTMAVTLHTCNGGNGYWDNCDRGGCQTNAFYANGNLMCPEDRCTINTNRPFTVSHYQTASQGE